LDLPSFLSSRKLVIELEVLVKRLSILLAGCFFATMSAAEDAPNCKDPPDQVTMNQCALLDFEKADAELNALWPEMKKQAEEEDARDGGGSTAFVDALAASQQAWIAFREAECKWQSYAAKGGSMEPMLVSICSAKLTRERIRQLQIGVSE
jgi:uncharacterized protein YecT (DUF1311 family)